MGATRIPRHLIAEGSARRRFPERVLDAIQQAIADGEKRHAGQVLFAAEGALPLRDLARGHGARERAREVFAHLRVWDTKHNSGVLIYVLLADHAIEILADRGIAARVDESEWKSICTQMQKRFAAGEFEQGAIEGVRAVSGLLATHFPDDGSARANELPDRPVVL
ncbi:MAG: TPM domain-containing protein [Proteobacteria bacterium]|nr:TPM domain-containing protein [Pseudomonadota bacterium]